MMRIQTESPLAYLARRTFSDYRFLTAEDTSQLPRLDAGQTLPSVERRAEFEAWWDKHAALPKEELEQLVAAERSKEAQQQLAVSAAAERGRFYHQPDAVADFKYWAKMTYWTLDEAIALSLGKSPATVNYKAVEKYAYPNPDGSQSSPFADEYLQRTEMAKRAIDWKKLYNPVAPTIFLRWAQRIELNLPEDLIKEIEANSFAIVDWQDLYEKQQQESAAIIQELNARICETVATIEAMKVTDSTAARWPWGAHETQNLRSLEAAAKKWWVNVSPADNTTAPTNEQVSIWLQKTHKLSKRVADAIATILRADGLPQGRRM